MRLFSQVKYLFRDGFYCSREWEESCNVERASERTEEAGNVKSSEGTDNPKEETTACQTENELTLFFLVVLCLVYFSNRQ
jgi:hypothetical protein